MKAHHKASVLIASTTDDDSKGNLPHTLYMAETHGPCTGHDSAEENGGRLIYMDHADLLNSSKVWFGYDSNAELEVLHEDMHSPECEEEECIGCDECTAVSVQLNVTLDINILRGMNTRALAMGYELRDLVPYGMHDLTRFKEE